jgi:hypothetical protein
LGGTPPEPALGLAYGFAASIDQSFISYTTAPLVAL